MKPFLLFIASIPITFLPLNANAQWAPGETSNWYYVGETNLLGVKIVNNKIVDCKYQGLQTGCGMPQFLKFSRVSDGVYSVYRLTSETEDRYTHTETFFCGADNVKQLGDRTILVNGTTRIRDPICGRDGWTSKYVKKTPSCPAGWKMFKSPEGTVCTK